MLGPLLVRSVNDEDSKLIEPVKLGWDDERGKPLVNEVESSSSDGTDAGLRDEVDEGCSVEPAGV